MRAPERDRLVEALVVRAILQGSSTPDRLLAVLNTLSDREVLGAVQRLLAEGAVQARAGEFVATEKGLEIVRSVAEELEKVQAENGRRLPGELEDLEPLLYALGFLTLAQDEEDYLVAAPE